MKSSSSTTREAWPGASALISLMPLPSPQTPTFPRFSEVIGETARVEPPKKRGLFLDLVGRPEVLLHDYLDNPERYGQPELYPLLQDLVTGTKSLDSLTDPEMRILDAATVDFSQAKTPRKEQAKQETAPTRPVYNEPKAVEQPDSLKDAPAYWWLR